MSLYLILAAFGGGILGAVVGGLPIFIFSGFVVLAYLVTGGVASVDMIGSVAFGPILSPHVSFAGAAAAAAYAHRKGKLEHGGDILAPLSKFNDPIILLVGGAFGVVGLLIEYVLRAVIGLPTDTIALTVVLCGVLGRVIFGKSGITGECTEDKRVYFPVNESLLSLVVMGLGLGLVASYFAIEFNLVLLGFGVGVGLLTFAQAGFPVPATHHIMVTAALAAVTTGNIFVGAIVGIGAAITADIFGKTFNSYCDSHIDPPAAAIAIWTSIVMIFF